MRWKIGLSTRTGSSGNGRGMLGMRHVKWQKWGTCALVAAALAAVAGSASADVIQVPLEAPTIQAGVDLAAEGDTVLVAPGIYQGAGNTNIDFGGVNLVLTSSGGSAATTIVCTGTDTCFFLHSGEDTTALIDGFTVETAGCAFFLEDAGAKLLDCRTEYCRRAVRAIRSGALIEGSVFAGETFGTDHKGVWAEGLPGIRVIDCRFESVLGGLAVTSSSVVVRGAVFNWVTGYVYGAAIYCEYSEVDIRDIVVENCMGMSAFGGLGHGLYADCCAGVLDGAAFVFNSGWGLNDRGLVYLDHFNLGTSVFEIRNVVFYSNFASEDIRTAADTLTIADVTIVGGRGGIWAWSGDATRIERTILAFNDWAVRNDVGDALTITHSCVFGNASGDSLPGHHYDNLFVDPLFCDFGGGDLTLRDDSPCLPGGNPWGVSIGALGAGGCGTDVPAEEPLQASFRLHRPTPNPSCGPFSLAFDVPIVGCSVEISIYNARGALVRRLTAMPPGPGRHEVTWDGCGTNGTRAAAGGYFVRATCGDEVSRTTLVLIR